MIRPIRKNLLIHTVTYLEPIEKDLWNDEKYKENELKFVRVESKKGYTINESGMKLTFGNLLFWDNRHSTKCKFKVGGKILFNDMEMDIVNISEFYADSNEIHHIEVFLQ